MNAGLSRRAVLAGMAGSLAWRQAAAAENVRVGLLQFGTVQWVADVIATHKLDAAQGINMKTAPLANNDAGRIALMAGAEDVIVSDWMFAAAQRAAGTPLCFWPFSSALGGIMVGRGSAVAGFRDLKGRTLGVAGGPVDKSWLVAQAACRASTGLDLGSEARVVYGAPPLLSAKLQQGELDAVLTFWNFAAKLEAEGCREIISVGDCARILGLPERLSLVGFVFRQDWAETHRGGIDGFLKAVAAAEHLLTISDAEWQRVRPLMDAPNDAVFENLKRRFVAGLPDTDMEQEQGDAGRVFEILLKMGGTKATAGLAALPAGLFWRGPDAGK